MSVTAAPPGQIEPIDEPARSDPFVSGLSEAIGGPLGEHAVRRGLRNDRFWVASRIVLALVCLTLSLHWVQKYPCRDGAWTNLSQYKQFCYTDVLALYYAEGLAGGKVPYRDHPVEYPVLTGAFMGALGLPVHSLAEAGHVLNQGQVFYDLNALALGILGVATCAVILALCRRRPWDAAMFALSPVLLVTATVNWDLLAIGLTAFALYAWAKSRPMVAGVLLGLATAAKLWPVLLFLPLLLLGLRSRRFIEAAGAACAGFAAWAAVNTPVYLLWPEAWARFKDLNWERGIDWGTVWYIGDHLPRGGGQSGFEWFHSLGANIPRLNVLSYVLMGVAFVGIGVLTFLAPRRPRLAQLAFLSVVVFLIFNKVWSQQFVLWLIPLAVLARPKWGAFVAWQVAELGYFFAFYGELMGASGKKVIPELVFIVASGLRLATVIVLCGFVVREILRPEQDAVRKTYDDDPDGGVFDGAPDADWVENLRHPRVLTATAR